MMPMPMSITDWSQVTASEHAGDSGMAYWRTQNFGDIRVRMVEYSAGYAADHWCSKGHVIFCVSGSLDIQLSDGKQLALRAGESYHVWDGEPGHRSSTVTGAQLFIVD
jgi:quercetin dioxygenase-like cupin family protein